MPACSKARSEAECRLDIIVFAYGTPLRLVPSYEPPYMPVYLLTQDLIFPPPELSQEDGLLAVGGDLSEERLLLAYSMGIFPWYSEDAPILWWSPDPRLVLYPNELRVSRSLRKVIKKDIFRITMDTAFERVISSCAEIRRSHHQGTWIVDEMIDAYCRLHYAGFAHSVEAWHGGELVGGLYGISLGRAFFGESMFARQSNASKVALYYLVNYIASLQFNFIDCQVPTDHLMSLGAQEIARSRFVSELRNSLQYPTFRGKWNFTAEDEL